MRLVDLDHPHGCFFRTGESFEGPVCPAHGSVMLAIRLSDGNVAIVWSCSAHMLRVASVIEGYAVNLMTGSTS